MNYSPRGAPLEAKFFGKACRGKIAFTSRRQALGRLRSLRFDDADRMEVYKCKACRKWHFGHKPRGPRAQSSEA